MVLRRKLLRYDLPLLPLSVLYVPRGPVLDWHDAALAEQVLAELERLARRQRAIEEAARAIVTGRTER